MKHTILIADDHAILRRGLIDLLRYEDDLEVVGEAADGEAAVQLAMKLRPDVVIMDLIMPVLDGVAATRMIRERVPAARILILTSFGTSADIAQAIADGATGVILKDDSTDNQLSAIRAVAKGESFFSPSLGAKPASAPITELTERQRQVLASVTRGLTNRDIAKEFSISPDAVKHHLNAICTKIGAANRTEAVAIALRKHLLKI